MGFVFEEMAREHTRDLAAVGAYSAEYIDAWWSSDGQHEIDLVGVTNGDQVSLIGTVTWAARPLGWEVLDNLEAHAAALPGYHPDLPRLIYGRGGCQPALAGAPNVRCFSVADLYR